MSDMPDTIQNTATPELEDRLYTVEEMARFLAVKVGALKDWTKLENDPCPCLRYGARILRFEKEPVLEWFKRQTKVWRRPKAKVE